MRAKIGNAQYKDYSYLSRYSVVPYYYNYNDSKYESGTAYQLSEDSSYVLHVVKVGDTYDSLAMYYYNNPIYYWAILDFNRIQDPFSTLKQGQLIKIPTISTIRFKKQGLR